jgi:hypothetical protein
MQWIDSMHEMLISAWALMSRGDDSTCNKLQQFTWKNPVIALAYSCWHFDRRVLCTDDIGMAS